MKERLAAMLSEDASKELFAGTFHRWGSGGGAMPGRRQPPATLY